MIVFWCVAIVVFLVVEAVTVGLASIWFALGSIAALISAALGAPLWLQVTWFIIVSGVTLWLTRPLAAKYINAKRQATNADRFIGISGKVTKTIDNISAQGEVFVGGKYWTARSANSEVIVEGSLVTILSIEGVKLIVAENAEVSAEEKHPVSEV